MNHQRIAIDWICRRGRKEFRIRSYILFQAVCESKETSAMQLFYIDFTG